MHTAFSAQAPTKELLRTFSPHLLLAAGLGSVPPNSTLTTMKVGSGSTAWADIIQVRWQSMDTAILQLLPSPWSTSSSTSTLQVSTSASPTLPSNTGSGTPLHSTHHDLSTGSKVGIAVGICALALFLLAGFLFWARSRRRLAFCSRTEDSIIYHSVAAAHQLDGRHNESPLKGELEVKGLLKSGSNRSPEFELDLQVLSVELLAELS